MSDDQTKQSRDHKRLAESGDGGNPTKSDDVPCEGDRQNPGAQPHPSDEPPIPDRDELPGTPRPAGS